jgi:hypothetical protein
VFRYRLLTNVDPAIVDELRGQGATFDLAGLDSDGTLVKLRSGLAAVGGVFVPSEPTAHHTYDLTDRTYANELAGAASVVDPDNVKAVTAFINQWGHLGVGVAPIGSPTWEPLLMGLLTLGAADAFDAIRDELRNFQTFVKYLAALKHKGTEKTWRVFIERLTPHLSSLKPAARWNGRAPAPAWLIDTPRSSLWATLWDWTTSVGDLQRCLYARCGAYFLRDHPRQDYCTSWCTNKAASARWYRKKGREQRRRDRQRKRRSSRRP